MNRELILSIIGSVLIHVGFLWGGSLFDKAKQAVKKEEAPPTMQMEIAPPPEPETPEVTPEAAHETDISDLAPPTQTDVPSTAVNAAFTQQIQPPPPPRFNKGGTITIPTGPSAPVGSNVKQVFDINNLDQKPDVRFQAAPRYPMALKRAGITGSVTIQFICDIQGEVREPKVISSTHREFEAPAIEALMKWKFKPGKKGNQTVNTRMEEEIEFALNRS